MIRRINNEPQPKASIQPIDTESTAAQVIDAKYDRLNEEAFDLAKRKEIDIFQLDDISEIHDQQRAIEKSQQKRKQKLAKRAMRRGYDLPHSHDSL